jgi:hypothetical protein
MRKKLLAILFIVLTQTTFAQIRDVFVYLPSSSTTLSTIRSGTIIWSKISTDITDNATITSPTSSITGVTNLVQGTWYYQVAATVSGTTTLDTVRVKVEYPAQSGDSLVRQLIIPDMAASANLRDDTTTNFLPGDGVPPFIHTEGGVQPNRFYYIRDRMNGAHVDSARGKYYSTIEDGWGGVDSYTKSELFFRNDYNFPIDSNITYMFEWRGYFPDPPTIPYGEIVTVIFQLHANNAVSPPFQFAIHNDSLSFAENFGMNNGSNSTTPHSGFPFFGLVPINNFYKQSHTVRVTLKEGKGYVGQAAFIKIEIDGVQKYYRNDGQIGETLQEDYPRFATVYDFSNVMVDPTNHTRNKKFSLTTESFKVFQANTGGAYIPPPTNIIQSLINKNKRVYK